MTHQDTSQPGFRVIAQLQCHDLAAAAWQLTDHFGFKAQRGYLDVRNLGSEVERVRMQRLDQVIELVRGAPDVTFGHGPIDHLALKANDADAAVMALRAKWVRLDPDVTPDGAIDLPMFWTDGVRIAFALGPEEARFELCQNNATTHAQAANQLVNLGGHDHYGVRCRDVDEATAFYAQFGFEPAGDVDIPTPDGPIDVRFMAHKVAVLEVASTPQTRAPNAQFATYPAWSKLIIETDAPDAIAASQIGPNGEVIEVRTGVPDAAFNFLQEDLG